MKIGFIGAGKVGCSLGKYFVQHGKEVGGYFSKNLQNAVWAKEFTKTKHYQSLEDVIADNEVVFLTVPDREIANVWSQLKQFPLQQKIICHCSGSLSSAVFSDISRMEAYGYSVHPLFAVNSKENSYKELSQAIFTIDGSPDKAEFVMQMLTSCGNKVLQIPGEKKTLYHAAAVTASNLVNGLLYMAQEMLVDCGFHSQDALEALSPLIRGNVDKALSVGLCEALTGPVERNDTTTVGAHMEMLSDRNGMAAAERHVLIPESDQAQIYRLLSAQVLEIAREKHKDRDYKEMEELLR
ncbi:MAG: DUF2520 domain-containing protein [Eubacterium sp.]|jgi:Uncharacterized conserved protein|nr:DUF2520 domain-containing protein [Eubacterium sp.]